MAQGTFLGRAGEGGEGASGDRLHIGQEDRPRCGQVPGEGRRPLHQHGPLEAYDAERGTTLVATLETFLATRNAALAARRLYLHYNTLKNRLAKIEEIIGPYLEDPDRCLSLALALRLRRLPTS
jgi:hypothetical protein